MKRVILMAAVLVFVGCGEKKQTPAPSSQVNKPPKVNTTKPEPSEVMPGSEGSAAAIEQGVRAVLEKPAGELSPADFATVKSLYLPHDGIDDLRSVARLTNLEELSVWNNKITDLTPLAGLQNLKQLIIFDNPELTRSEIDKLQAALPGCIIRHNAKKF
jgi:hypothetical protein